MYLLVLITVVVRRYQVRKVVALCTGCFWSSLMGRLGTMCCLLGASHTNDQLLHEMTTSITCYRSYISYWKGQFHLENWKPDIYFLVISSQRDHSFMCFYTWSKAVHGTFPKPTFVKERIYRTSAEFRILWNENESLAEHMEVGYCCYHGSMEWLSRSQGMAFPLHSGEATSRNIIIK
jgi:hypothetical protein